MNVEQMNDWDVQLAANPDGGSVFQAAELAETKRLGGWEPLYQTYDGMAVTVLQKQVWGLGNFWYIPKGPGVAAVDQLHKLLPHLQQSARTSGVFAIKIEPELIKSTAVANQLVGLGLVASRAIQPNSSTVLVDLQPSEADLLAGFSQKARHAINRAVRDGVSVQAVPFTDQNAKIMYDLLVQTAQGRFEGAIRSYDYYHQFWHNFYATGRGSLFFAYSGGQVVSAAFAMYLGRKSTYKDGASVRDKQVYGASHLLQWEVMRWMKARGCVQHDLCGAPPSDRADDPTHPHHGIGRFKTSFNKHITDYVGGYDLPISPLRYKLWVAFGERLTLRSYATRHHQNWY